MFHADCAQNSNTPKPATHVGSHWQAGSIGAEAAKVCGTK
jgi:hypothetical protein